MKSYRCHKVVQAAKIEVVGLGDMDEGPAYLHLEGGERARLPYPKFNPEVGGYYVLYDNGHCSYSPAEAFEKGYKGVVTDLASLDVKVDSGTQEPAAAYEGGLPAGFSKIIASLKRVQSDLTEAQKTFVLGSPEWHDLETVDDKIHEALARLGD